MFTLRSLLLGVIASLFFAMLSPAQTVFLGNNSDALRAADFDAVTGQLANERSVAPIAKASFLARSRDGQQLYAVNDAQGGTVHAFAVASDGALTVLNSRPSGGAGPCDVALSPDGRLLAVANYSGGSVSVFPVALPAGTIAESVAFFQLTHAANVFAGRQEKPHAHGVTWSPDGTRLFVPDLGGDRVYVYRRALSSDTLEPHPTQPWLELPPGSGPRHAAFSPDGAHLYVINELSNTVAVFTSAPGPVADGASHFILAQTIPTLPAGFAGANTTAEIAVHPAGHTVYASNRGHDSLALFARDARAGLLTASGHVAVPAHPRHFALSPDARWLLVAGRDANAIAAFSVAPSTGALTLSASPIFSITRPLCVRF
jgi:6-phosphogluconolactonase